MIALLLALVLTSQVVVIGPGHLSYAGEGTLERVAERRLKNGWGVTQDWRAYTALVAPADCGLIGRSGWLVTGGNAMPALVVDCEQDAHSGQMAERGLLADTNREEMAHRRAWLVLR